MEFNRKLFSELKVLVHSFSHNPFPIKLVFGPSRYPNPFLVSFTCVFAFVCSAVSPHWNPWGILNPPSLGPTSFQSVHSALCRPSTWAAHHIWSVPWLPANLALGHDIWPNKINSTVNESWVPPIGLIAHKRTAHPEKFSPTALSGCLAALRGQCYIFLPSEWCKHNTGHFNIHTHALVFPAISEAGHEGRAQV